MFLNVDTKGSIPCVDAEGRSGTFNFSYKGDTIFAFDSDRKPYDCWCAWAQIKIDHGKPVVDANPTVLDWFEKNGRLDEYLKALNFHIIERYLVVPRLEFNEPEGKLALDEQMVSFLNERAITVRVA